MNIITISREFGSGGRELGKRLADLLEYDYYDHEIINALIKKLNLMKIILKKFGKSDADVLLANYKPFRIFVCKDGF